MLTKEDYAVIKALHKRGVYLKDIAAELGVHPRTVRRALQRGNAPAPSRPLAPASSTPSNLRSTACSPRASGTALPLLCQAPKIDGP